MPMLPDLKVEQMPTAELVPYAGNAKEHPKKQVREIANSIEQFGFADPVGVWTRPDGQLEIVEGHGRVMAAKLLGMETVTVIRLDHLDDDGRRAYAHVHNQTTLTSGFDMDALKLDLESIPGFDWSEFGFDANPMEAFLDEIIEDEPPDAVPSRCERGQVWQLGRHRVMCGDSTDADDVATLIDGNRADLLLTDPPYGMHLDTDFSSCLGSLGRKHGTKGNKYDRVIGDNDDFSPTLITSIFDNFKHVEEVFLFGADYYAELIPERKNGSWLVWDKRKPSQADAIGSEFELIWSKKKHKRRVLRHDWFGFLSSENAKDAHNRVHPTQKPVTLIADIINQWGNNAEVIVDLFGGSGTTLIAAEQLGRTCYMMELDPHYCDVIIARWEQFTGRKAELLA